MTAYPMPCTQAGLITGCFLLRVHLLTMVSQRSTPTLSSSSRFHSCFFRSIGFGLKTIIYIYICPQILMVDFPNKRIQKKTMIRRGCCPETMIPKLNPAGRCIVALWNPRILGVHAWKASWYVRPLWKPPCRARVVGEMGKRIYIYRLHLFKKCWRQHASTRWWIYDAWSSRCG